MATTMALRLFGSVVGSLPAHPHAGQYRLLDSGGLRRLESFDGIAISRPCPSATWAPGLPAERWQQAQLEFDAATGAWSGPALGELDVDEGGWHLGGPGFVLALRPRASGQLGAFPEQRENWEWLRAVCGAADTELRVLNAFAHTGGSSLACAASGQVDVTHLDGSKPAITQARMNQELSRLSHATLRWVCEDAMTYLVRAARHGHVFDGLILDPPAFGRGGKRGKDWRIDRDFPRLLQLLPDLLSEQPSFVLLTAHDAELGPEALRDALARVLAAARADGGEVEHGELVLRADEPGGVDLRMGAFARWSRVPDAAAAR